MSRTDFLKPLNDIACCCESAAQDYTGELKSLLSSLCQRIQARERGYEAAEIQTTLPMLQKALESYRSGDTYQGVMLLTSVSRNWWEAVAP